MALILLYIGPRLGRLKRIWDEEGIESQQGALLVRRLFLVGRIELVLLVLIIFDMVLKPGA